MLRWLKRLFTEESVIDPEPDDLWNAMESMDSRNSLARLHQLNLNSKQFPLVKGLLDGTLSPADRPGVTDWCQSEAVSPTGMDALTYALQRVLESAATTYVIPTGQEVPVAMLPKFVLPGDLTLAVCHVGSTPVVITSLDDFLSSNGIVEYSLKTLTPSKLRRRVTKQPDFDRNRSNRGLTQSVTIEKRADDQQRLLEPLEVSELVDVINSELGYDLIPDQLRIEAGPIDQFGLYSCTAQIDSITEKQIKFWVVPKVDFDPTTER